MFRSIDRHGRAGAALSGRAVALIVQRRAAAAGLDAEGFAGHSLRAGFATSAAASGIEERMIAETTRHRSTAILRRYIRTGGCLSATSPPRWSCDERQARAPVDCSHVLVEGCCDGTL